MPKDFGRFIADTACDVALPDTATRDDARVLALTLGCTHEGTSSIITRRDAMGYVGGEHWTLATHYGAMCDTPDGPRFVEAFMLGFADAHPDTPRPRNVHDFRNARPYGGREWHPDVILSVLPDGLCRIASADA